MFGPIIVFAVAVAIVVTYMFTVNRCLRSDEHWNEGGHGVAPAAPAPEPERNGAWLTPKHA